MLKMKTFIKTKIPIKYFYKLGSTLKNPKYSDIQICYSSYAVQNLVGAKLPRLHKFNKIYENKETFWVVHYSNILLTPIFTICNNNFCFSSFTLSDLSLV